MNIYYPSQAKKDDKIIRNRGCIEPFSDNTITDHLIAHGTQMVLFNGADFDGIGNSTKEWKKAGPEDFVSEKVEEDSLKTEDSLKKVLLYMIKNVTEKILVEYIEYLQPQYMKRTQAQRARNAKVKEDIEEREERRRREEGFGPGWSVGGKRRRTRPRKGRRSKKGVARKARNKTRRRRRRRGKKSKKH